MSGFKFTTDRLTLFLGASAPGGLNLKPRLAYHYENPMAFKNEANFLLVLFKQKNKILVKTYLFTTWFTEKFKPTLETHFTHTHTHTHTHNNSFKILLFIDDAPGHPRTLMMSMGFPRQEYWSNTVRLILFPCLQAQHPFCSLKPIN